MFVWLLYVFTVSSDTYKVVYRGGWNHCLGFTMAKRFQFRLEGLHKYRQHKTTEAKNALGTIAQARMAKEREISETKEYLESLQWKNSSVKASQMQAHFAHIQSVTADIERLQQELRNIMEIESMRRNELTQTMRDEKVIDNLKEKKLAEYNESVLHEEMNTMDEMAQRAVKVL